MCLECGIWPPEHLNLNKRWNLAKIPSYISSLAFVLIFSLPEGHHCPFQLFLPLFQVIEEHAGRELELAVVDF
jgi:hypothetical protein